MSAVVEIFTPAQVAAMFPRADGTPMSERSLRSEARRHGCCMVVGKRKPGNIVMCPKCGAAAAFQPSPVPDKSG